MSTEDRVKQFVTDAQQPRSPKSVKQMSILQKFLFKNQNYRFHESSRTQLLAAIELYLNMFDRAPSYVANESPSAEGLLEDALKVPIFNGKMKGKMVRWLEEVHARNEGKTVGKEEERGREKEDWELDWDDPRAWGEDES